MPNPPLDGGRDQPSFYQRLSERVIYVGRPTAERTKERENERRKALKSEATTGARNANGKRLKVFIKSVNSFAPLNPGRFLVSPTLLPGDVSRAQRVFALSIRLLFDGF